jgi:hypothetical protein
MPRMTNEEIKQNCAGLANLVSVAQAQGADTSRLYEEFAYSLLLRAYEEAAQITETDPAQAAHNIRALKQALDADPTVRTPAVL